MPLLSSVIRVLLDHLVRQQTRQGTMRSEAIILFLKQPDFSFASSSERNQLTFRHPSQKLPLNDSMSGCPLVISGPDDSCRAASRLIVATLGSLPDSEISKLFHYVDGRLHRQFLLVPELEIGTTRLLYLVDKEISQLRLRVVTAVTSRSSTRSLYIDKSRHPKRTGQIKLQLSERNESIRWIIQFLRKLTLWY